MGWKLGARSQTASGERGGVPLGGKRSPSAEPVASPPGAGAGLRAGVAQVCGAAAGALRLLAQWPRGKAVPGGRWSGPARAPPTGRRRGGAGRWRLCSAAERRCRQPAPLCRRPCPPSLLPSLGRLRPPRPGGISAGSPVWVGWMLGVPLWPPSVWGCALTAVPAGWAESKLGPQRWNWHSWVSVLPPPDLKKEGVGGVSHLLVSFAPLLAVRRPEDLGFCPPVSIPASPGGVSGTGWG